jgi:hypothetical protein
MTVISKIDLFFTNVVAWLIYKIGFVLVALLGILSIVSVPVSFLEYAEGFADLDFLEISLIALFFIMIWRFVKKSRIAGLSRWSTTKKLFLVLATGLLFPFLVEALFLFYLLNDQGNLTVAYLVSHDDFISFFCTILIIVLLYGLVPSAIRSRVSTADQVKTPEDISVESVSNPELTPNGI